MKKKWIFIIVGVVVALVLIRIALPHFVTRHVNQILNDMPGYEGSIADVDISLYRGAYSIDELKIFKVPGNRKIPFIDIPIVDLSLEWRALLDGAIVGEVIFDRPTLNFINKGQAGENVDWGDRLKRLLPVHINRLQAFDGTVVFYDFSTNPNVDLRLRALNLVATNLNNAQDQETALPSTVKATAVSIGDGELKLSMDINLLKPVPDLDMDLEFENVHMPALNDFFRAYAKVDVERGIFNLYAEIIVTDGVLEGYVKPMAENVGIVDWKKDSKNPISLIWQTIVGFAVTIFKNQSTDQLATRIPLSGDLNNVDVSVWVAIWNIFRNGFIQAFSKSTDDSIQFEPDANNPQPAETDT